MKLQIISCLAAIVAIVCGAHDSEQDYTSLRLSLLEKIENRLSAPIMANTISHLHLLTGIPDKFVSLLNAHVEKQQVASQEDFQRSMEGIYQFLFEIYNYHPAIAERCKNDFASSWVCSTCLEVSRVPSGLGNVE